MAITPLPPTEFLHECFSYDPATGLFVWRRRPQSHFPDEITAHYWNLRYAGTTALAQDCQGHLKGEVRYEGRRYRLFAHRVAFALMTGQEPEQIDHVNGAKSDNRWGNIRAATASGNMRNRPPRQKHLPKCVFPTGKGRFYSRTYGPDGENAYLGTFGTPAEAHAAYVAFVKPFHGEFFNPGPPTPTIWD